MNCAKCGGSTETDRRDSVEFERCSICGGVWIERYALAVILGRPNEAHELDWSGRSAELDGGRETGIRCAVCGKELIARQARGIELDVCQGCGGLFLDSSELETLRASARREARSERLRNVAGAAEDLTDGLAVDSAWDFLVAAIRGLLLRG